MEPPYGASMLEAVRTGKTLQTARVCLDARDSGLTSQTIQNGAASSRSRASWYLDQGTGTVERRRNVGSRDPDRRLSGPQAGELQPRA
jgi:hypothetical protein